jgi:tRNA threonylcarbamoyladenosine biosynthesis protein TsaB
MSEHHSEPPRWRLVLDTATRQSTIAIGDGRRCVAESRRTSEHRHGALVLEQIDEVLQRAGIDRTGISAIGVGTGPGSFTGLRVGLATAKTLAYGLGCPIVGIATADALRGAVEARGHAGARGFSVVLPAGARDHYLAPAGGAPTLLPPAGSLAAALGGIPAIAVDLPETGPDLDGAAGLGPDAAARGRAAIEGLAAALLALADERLTSGESDDVGALVPAYVALPRGIRPVAEAMAWSPDLR